MSDEPEGGHPRWIGLAGWTNLAKSLSSFLLQLACIPAGPAAVDVVVALCDIASEQNLLLHSITADTASLRSGPFKTAQLLLREANRVSATDEEWHNILARARDELYG